MISYYFKGSARVQWVLFGFYQETIFGGEGILFHRAKTSPACSINWKTSQVERDSASATELVMRTRPRTHGSFDPLTCPARPDKQSIKNLVMHPSDSGFLGVSETNYTSIRSTLLSLLEDV